MKRRQLLQAGGALSVALLAGCALPVIPKRPTPGAEDALGWVRHQAGRYQLLLPRSEMGQNIATGLKQIACDELGLAWHELELVLPDTDQIGRVRATVGSASMQDFGLLLAQACATLRDAVAAGHPPGRLPAQPRPARELRAFAAGARHVGRSVPIEQGAAIVRGQALYVADTRRPGMLFGRVLRAPASPELASRLVAVDEAAARAVPGFVALVRDPLLQLGSSEGLGLLARTPGALDRLEAALQPRWQIDGSFEQAAVDEAIDVDRHLQRGALAHRVLDDPLDTTAPWSVDLRIDLPLAAHAPIEPRAAVAEFGADGRLHLWVGSQDPFYQRDVVVRRLGLDEASVCVHACRVGGAFGGKTLCTVELEAAVLARAVGQAVKVQWTRAQELRLGFHRPPSSHRVRARLHEGRLDQWWHAISSSHIFFTNAGLPAWMQRFTDWVGDDGVARGATPPYRARRRRAEFALTRLPVYTGPWRGLGAGPNNLAIESAIDECARAAGADPLQFRLQHVEDPRLARVLRRVDAHFTRQKPGQPATAATPTERATSGDTLRRGSGLACGIYKAMSYAAVVAEVAVAADGQWRVTRLVCAHDCGRVVNPGQVQAQCEGNLVWGLGMVASDQLPVAAGQVGPATWAEAPIPRFDSVPPMTVLLVDEGEPPSGAGETVIVAAAAAIANALRSATGVRARRFPVAAADLKS